MAAVATILDIGKERYVALMPPIRFWLNPIYSLGRDVVLIISRWPLWWPCNDLDVGIEIFFSNSESLCCSDASHQVSA